MSKFATPVVIVILAVIAVVLGYTIYNQSTSNKTAPRETEQPTRNVTSTPIGSKAAALTVDERLALQTPGANATEAERKAHFDAAVRAAKYVNTLDISQCIGTPVVLRVAAKQTLTVNNPDTQDHVIVIDKDHTYIVPASGKKEIVIDFGKGGGLYGYGCDASQTTSGLFLVGQ